MEQSTIFYPALQGKCLLRLKQKAGCIKPSHGMLSLALYFSLPGLAPQKYTLLNAIVSLTNNSFGLGILPLIWFTKENICYARESSHTTMDRQEQK